MDKVYLVCKGSKEAYEVLLVTETEEEAEMYGLARRSVDGNVDNLFLECHSVVKSGVIDEIFEKTMNKHKKGAVK